MGYQNLFFAIAVVVAILFFFMMRTTRKDGNSSEGETLPVPVKEKKRTKCPFYGFHRASNVLIDQDGNQCALEFGYTPCHMEMSGTEPDFMTCPFFYSNEGRRTFLCSCEKAKVRVFAEEFRPDGKDAWDGIPFASWNNHVMGREHE